MKISIDHAIPVIHEVLLLENKEQAADRCLSESANRGIEAARAAITAIEAMNKVVGDRE